MCILCLWLIWNLRQKILTWILPDVLPFKADGYRSVWLSDAPASDTWICGWNRNVLVF
jgi:hypothetical protein